MRSPMHCASAFFRGSLVRLEDYPLIACLLGRHGVFVRPVRTRLSATAPHFVAYFQQLGLEPLETKIERPDIVAASKEVAQALEIAEKAPVVHRLFLQGTTTEYYRMTGKLLPR